MNITVEFETKFNIDRNIMSPQTIDYQKVSGKLEQETKKFTASLEGNEENVIDVLRYLYDGYFYKPCKYTVDGVDENVEKYIFFLFITRVRYGETAQVLW